MGGCSEKNQGAVVADGEMDTGRAGAIREDEREERNLKMGEGGKEGCDQTF